MLKSFYFHYSQSEYILDDKESHLWSFRFSVHFSFIFLRFMKCFFGSWGIRPPFIIKLDPTKNATRKLSSFILHLLLWIPQERKFHHFFLLKAIGKKTNLYSFLYYTTVTVEVFLKIAFDIPGKYLIPSSIFILDLIRLYSQREPRDLEWNAIYTALLISAAYKLQRGFQTNQTEGCSQVSSNVFRIRFGVQISQPDNRLYSAKYFVNFLSLFRKFCETNHDCLLPHRFQYITH